MAVNSRVVTRRPVAIPQGETPMARLIIKSSIELRIA